MRTLELRLEHVDYGWTFEGGAAGAERYRPDEPRSSGDQARIAAALEFFDRALIRGMASAVSPAPHSSGGQLPGVIFEHAAALTLLRFGVRIVGLEAEP
jgi:hypothetical protein